jgi:hypothetical protein
MSILPKELQGRKASEVFLEYASPWLETYLEEVSKATLEEIEYILKVPWLIWNAMVMKNDSNQKVDYLASLNLLLKGAPLKVKKLTDSMKRRKRTTFSKYNYLLGDFKLRVDESSNEVKLVVETRIPSKKIVK